MYFLAEELHEEAKYVFFARGAQRRGQKWTYLAEECSDEAKKYIVD